MNKAIIRCLHGVETCGRAMARRGGVLYERLSGMGTDDKKAPCPEVQAWRLSNQIRAGYEVIPVAEGGDDGGVSGTEVRMAVSVAEERDVEVFGSDSMGGCPTQGGRMGRPARYDRRDRVNFINTLYKKPIRVKLIRNG